MTIVKLKYKQQLDIDGIVFVDPDFIYCNPSVKQIGIHYQGEYKVPIIQNKVERDQGYIVVNGKKYFIPQPAYLESWSDHEILQNCLHPEYRKQRATASFDGIAILRN